MDEPRLEQLASLWVDDRSIAYMAAAIQRSSRDGAPPWSLLIVNATPAIESGDMSIRLRTRDGTWYQSRAKRKFETETNVRTTVLEGTQPLVTVD